MEHTFHFLPLFLKSGPFSQVWKPDCLPGNRPRPRRTILPIYSICQFLNSFPYYPSNCWPHKRGWNTFCLHPHKINPSFSFVFLYLCRNNFCAVAVDCLNPLLSNKSLCGVKFEYVTAREGGKVGDILTHLSPNALCFCLSDLGCLTSEDRPMLTGDLGDPLDRGGGLGTFEQVWAVFKWQEMLVICL